MAKKPDLLPGTLDMLADAGLRRRIKDKGRRRIELGASLTETLELYTAALLGSVPEKSSDLFLTPNSPQDAARPPTMEG